MPHANAVFAFHGFAECEHLVGARIADAERHQQAESGFRHQREIDERRRKQRVLGQHDQIAMQQHRRSDADGASLNGGD